MMRRERRQVRRGRRPIRRARHDEMYSLADVARVMEYEISGFRAGNPRDLNSLVSDFADHQYSEGQYNIIGGGY